MQTINELLRSVTSDYLSQIDMDNIPSPKVIEEELIQETNKMIEEENLGPRDPNAPSNASIKDAYPNQRKQDEKIRKIKTLEPFQLAQIIATLHGACRICTISGAHGNEDYDMLGIYQTEGENRGIYVTSEQAFRSLIRNYHATMSTTQFQEVMTILRDITVRKSVCQEPDLIAVNNGIFDYSSKILMDFDPDYVFLTKSKVNFVPNATNPIIHNEEDDTDWDVVSWMDELSDDPEIVTLLWEILSAIIRPNVPWNKSAWLYSEFGNNGKGTLCTLMRNLCGPGSHASIPLKDFGAEFLLEPLTRVSAIIVDENDVGTYIDQAANLKAVITNDVITINRKFKTPIVHQFRGFMVQCMNEFPKVKDRSDSFYRRQLFIPMNKRFEGIERKYIKSDYLHRQDVLEYVLYRVLYESNFYTLSEPQSCKDVLTDYKEYNDPVRQFFLEVEENAVWDLLPYTFLYDLYRCWSVKNIPSGQILPSRTFLKEIKVLTKQSDVFYLLDGNPSIRTANRMDKPELLINEYDVIDWMNSSYKGNDVNKKCQPALKENYRGILRKCQQNDNLNQICSGPIDTLTKNFIETQQTNDGTK